MSWLESLEKLKDLVNIKLTFNLSKLINIKIDCSNKTEKLEIKEDSLIINLAQLNLNEKKVFKEMIQSVFQSDVPILEERFSGKLEELKKEENENDSKKIIEYFNLDSTDFLWITQNFGLKLL